MDQQIKELEINGKTYIRKQDADIAPRAEQLDGLDYCIVRTYSAGVFAGYVKSREGREVMVVNSRRLWHWSGAASLSQMAEEGTTAPDSCKFPCVVEHTVLLEAIEIIKCSEQARKSIQGVEVWKK